MAKRGRMSKSHSRKQFRAGTRTNGKNVTYTTHSMRGGIRL